MSILRSVQFSHQEMPYMNMSKEIYQVVFKEIPYIAALRQIALNWYFY